MKNALNLDAMVNKIERRSPLSRRDRDAFLALPHRLVKHERGKFIVREGERLANISLLLAGFASCHRITKGGSRQIQSVHMAGDLLDLQNGAGDLALCNVQALSSVTIALISRPALFALASERPSIATALWRDTGANAVILAEWLVNIGRRCARSRIAHLICELAVRQESAGLATGPNYSWAFTQEQIGDATGLTTVHVNRTMQGLRKDGFLRTDHGQVSILDWSGLSAAGDFDRNYLQLSASRSLATHNGLSLGRAH